MIKSDFVNIYVRIFKKKPIFFVITVLCYALFFIWFSFRSEIQNAMTYVREGKQLEYQIRVLDEELRSKEVILDTLTRRSKTASFIKDIEFNENWDSDKNKIELERLFEYADFARKKNDSKRAERIYNEALSIQDNLTANYNLGSLYYFEGRLEAAISVWEKFIKVDSQNNYPIVRFYLGVAYHEKGDEEKSMNNIKIYLNAVDN